MDIGTAVALIVSVPGIIALVNLAKSVTDLGKWAALVAFVLGVGINLAAWAAGAAYVGADPFSVAALGAMTGLAASGIHDVTNPPKTNRLTFISLDDDAEAERMDEERLAADTDE